MACCPLSQGPRLVHDHYFCSNRLVSIQLSNKKNNEEALITQFFTGFNSFQRQGGIICLCPPRSRNGTTNTGSPNSQYEVHLINDLCSVFDGTVLFRSRPLRIWALFKRLLWNWNNEEFNRSMKENFALLTIIKMHVPRLVWFWAQGYGDFYRWRLKTWAKYRKTEVNQKISLGKYIFIHVD